MRRLSILTCAAALLGSAGFGTTAVAQKTEPAPKPSSPKTRAPGDECTSTGEGRIECRKTIERGFGARMDSAMMKRAALGLQLSPTGTARDTLGVFVSSVTPKGPAETAGIIEGDRIVSINGVDLRVAPGDVEDGYASGLPSHRLQREVAKLTPGSRVSIRVYSGGRIRDVQVTTGRASDLLRSRAFINFGDGPGSSFIFRDGMEMPPMPPMPPMAHMEPMMRMEHMPQMMEHMRMMESMPEMQKLREAMPQLRRMEMSPEWRKLQESMPELRRMDIRGLPPMRMNEGGYRTLISPRATYRIRSPKEVHKVVPLRAKVEAEQKAKVRTDSVKKAK